MENWVYLERTGQVEFKGDWGNVLENAVGAKELVVQLTGWPVRV